MLRRFEAIAGGGYPYFVAESRAGSAGYAYASAYRARPAYRFTVEDSSTSRPRRRAKASAARCSRALIERAATHGFRLMIAVIGDSANIASIALHRAVGFTLCGTIHSVGYKHGRWLDTGPHAAAARPGRRHRAGLTRRLPLAAGPRELRSASGSELDEPDPLFEHLST